MTLADLHDDGFRVTEIGDYRLRVNAEHEGRVVWAIRRRRMRESEMRAA
jgi:hypothetical protein